MRTTLLALLFAASASAADLTLTWTDNSTNEDGFIIERAPKPDSGSAPLTSFAEVARVPANVVTYTDRNLPPSTAFSYRVLAYNAAGKSAPSNISTATTAALPPPIAPTTLKVVPVPIPAS
jgi:hypothetical protein